MAEGSTAKASNTIWDVVWIFVGIVVGIFLLFFVIWFLRGIWDLAGQVRFPRGAFPTHQSSGSAYPATQTKVAPKRTVGGWCAPGRHLEFDQRVQSGNVIRDYKKCVDD